MGALGICIVGMMWKLSADREYRTKFPAEGRFYPSRKYAEIHSSNTAFNLIYWCSWSKQIIEHEKAEALKKEQS